MPFKDAKGSRIQGFKGSSVFLQNSKLLTHLVHMFCKSLTFIIAEFSLGQ